jgi:hypothetical protein
MRATKYVHYQPAIGRAKKLTFDYACKLVLSDFDRSPLTHDAKIEIFNARIKGATVQEFLREREDAARFLPIMQTAFSASYAQT